MTMLEIIENYPETEEVFRAYDDIAGKCLLCNNYLIPLRPLQWSIV